MATLTIRNLPEDLVTRLKRTAARRERSMEQEVRELLFERYATRRALIARIRQRWSELPPSEANEVDAWLVASRDGDNADGV
ncbi:MAG: hypothetical protein PHU25_03790 [Deltaproteobacteria bacterium]|nr:hypothetical protein [Deltaproteobacteria bacterium]